MEAAEYVLQEENITDKDSLWNEVRRVCPMPEYFGDNLDAWADLVSEREWKVKVDDPSQLELTLGEYGRIFLHICQGI